MKKAIKEALDEIAQADAEGRLQPHAVVERAKARSSPLHDCFTWDDTKAGALWRIEEARGLIRTYRVVIEQKPPVTTRAFISLKSSRARGGGYTPIERILSDADLHQEMLRDALEDVAEVERRYGHLQELQPVFVAARRVRRRIGKEKAARSAAAA
jgi:hypothetical protein